MKERERERETSEYRRRVDTSFAFWLTFYMPRSETRVIVIIIAAAAAFYF